ncbi:hypothetical protein PM082_021026 [Marasmius tenuissimus]|nr:hypothetical protein PM082_021026 [Marasmius tenuissimus]
MLLSRHLSEMNLPRTNAGSFSNFGVPWDLGAHTPQLRPVSNARISAFSARARAGLVRYSSENQATQKPSTFVPTSSRDHFGFTAMGMYSATSGRVKYQYGSMIPSGLLLPDILKVINIFRLLCLTVRRSTVRHLPSISEERYSPRDFMDLSISQYCLSVPKSSPSD